MKYKSAELIGGGTREGKIASLGRASYTRFEDAATLTISMGPHAIVASPVAKVTI
jgi:hypothetical protein